MMPPDPVSGETPQPSIPVTTEPPQPQPSVYRWYHKAGAILLVTICLEIGFYLLIVPWTDSWDKIGSFAGKLRPYCDSLYVRGAISGIGIVNLYLSLSEMFRLRRFAKR
jgi:hypothetical protein